MVKTTPVIVVDDLEPLLPDWRTHLRAKGPQRTTIDAYLVVGRTFRDWLASRSMPTTATGIAPEHVEAYWPT